VFVVAAAGGVPKRLTYHPGGTKIWSGGRRDGKECAVFLSTRSSYYNFAPKLFRCARRWLPRPSIPCPLWAGASLSPDGSHISPTCPSQWSARLEALPRRSDDADLVRTLKIRASRRVPRDNSNDFKSHVGWKARSTSVGP